MSRAAALSLSSLSFIVSIPAISVAVNCCKYFYTVTRPSEHYTVIICNSFCVRCGSLTHSGIVESFGESQWELLSLVENTQRGSQQRMIEYFPQYLQQFTVTEMAGMETIKLQEERDRAKEEMSKIKVDREKEKHRVLMEKVRECIRGADEGRKRALLEKSQAEKDLKAKAREVERMITTANQERDRALEAKKEIELQQQLVSMEKEGVEKRARELERERNEARFEVQKEKEKSIRERNRSEERRRLLMSERDSVIEGSRRAEYERESNETSSTGKSWKKRSRDFDRKKRRRL